MSGSQSSSTSAREHELEQALVRSEERYLVAARAAGVAIWDWDLSAERMHWSRSVEGILGHPIESLSSLDLWLEYIHPSDRTRVAGGIRHAVETGQSQWSDTLQFLKRDGTYASVIGRCWILHDGLGNAQRIVGGFIDVTRERRLAQKLEEQVDLLEHSQQELREAVRVRDDFLSIASHELRTPLTALQLQVQGMLRGPIFESAEERLRVRMRSCERMIGRMVHLIDQLLDVSRLNAGQLSLEIEDVDLAEVIRVVIDRMQPDIQRSDCQLSVTIPERLEGRWDKTRLDQVFCNLLANALKYGVGKPIEIQAAADDERATLVVTDHGIGIAPEQQGRIFQRFERAVSHSHYSGFGLGLWIVRCILDAMGGTVRVESAVDEGATFEVMLPRRQSDPAPPVGPGDGAPLGGDGQ